MPLLRKVSELFFSGLGVLGDLAVKFFRAIL